MTQNSSQDLPEAGLAQPLAYESVNSAGDMRLVANMIGLLLAGHALTLIGSIFSQSFFLFFMGATRTGWQSSLTLTLSFAPLATAVLTAVAIFRRSSSAIILAIIHETIRMAFSLVMVSSQILALRNSLPANYNYVLAGQSVIQLCYYAIEMIVLVMILRRCRDRGVLS